MKYKIKNGLLLLYENGSFLTRKEDLFISGTTIESIGGEPDGSPAEYEEIDASHRLIMPGLINAHTHAYMTFMKNSADDMPLNAWLQNRIFPIEAKMSKPDFYWATLFGCIEMIKTGTTCFLDMHICEDECAKAMQDIGMRAFLGKCITGSDLYTDGYDCFSKALSEKEQYESDLLQFALSPHSVYACSPKLLTQITDEAQKRNMHKHIHLSESTKEVEDCIAAYGKTPVALLQDIGFLDNRTIAAHCVKLNESDIQMLHDKQVSVVTDAASNAKLGNGIAPIGQMLRKSVNVCLGTDSAASNNSLNMFRELGIFASLHKAVNETATSFSANTCLECVTMHSAAALGMQNKIGVIAKGAFADLVFMDLQSASLFPNNNIVSSLCYSANGNEVSSVMIHGKFIMKDRVLTTIDEQRVFFEINRIADTYL